jgi:tRNA nucleotidyltransferase (CCA-adding enzyme)
MIDINKVPHQVIYVIRRLEQFGWEGYLVGGAVRDLLLNREAHDWDIATNCPLSEIESLFYNVKIVGASFGVALVKICDMDIQIARFRTDGIYEDNRHPESVNFVDDIMEDLQRRDLTINAMAWNPKEFVYVDRALEDLRKKVIRMVGNPKDRFQEDGLRLLRAIRLSCQLGFNIEYYTIVAIYDSASLITSISFERIQEELNKILLSDNAGFGILDLYDVQLLQHIIPELINCYDCWQNNYHNYDVFRHITHVIDFIPNDLSMRLTALFHDIGKPLCKTTEENGHVHFYGHDEVSANMAKEIMTRLKYDNQMIDEVIYLVRYHMELMNAPFNSNKAIRKLLNRHGESRLRKLIEFRRADLLGSGTRDNEDVENLIREYKYRLEEVLKEKPATKFEDLAIDGNDIMEITGLKPGPEVGWHKERLMELVLEDPWLNTRERLIGLLNS